ncbi:glutamate--tRNA ligase [Candidatus Uhrbacteria bacterium]|nr:glutamate--tRNA ligase [Candidatus Uhrbacteria bacterium]
MKPVRTRFAPSPTGYLHIGGLRTALYAYFFARQHQGSLVFRIEDTDRERYIPGATEALIRTLDVMGISYDEGPVLDDKGDIAEKGSFGPYIQSKRLDTYKQWAEELLRVGSAYRCFCSAERLETMRREQTLAKRMTKYDRTCLHLSKEESDRRAGAGESYVIRLLVPDGETIFEDVVYGAMKFPNADVDDQVLLKSDGFPTYHLAVVVDDHFMEISHVLRGEDWISSTPKQIMLYAALGWEAPTFAHLPNLLNADRTKLSKRQGDVAVEDYLKRGYLPAALNNFVATLGFNPKSDQEIYSTEELTALFDLSRVNRAGAVVNYEKLDWVNAHYLRHLNIEELARAVHPFSETLDFQNPVLLRALTVERERATTLAELPGRLGPYLEPLDYDPGLLVWRKSTREDAVAQLGRLVEHLSTVADEIFSEVLALENNVQTYLAANQLDRGGVLWPMRVALSGKAQSPSPYELAWVFGKLETLYRLEEARKRLA